MTSLKDQVDENMKVIDRHRELIYSNGMPLPLTMGQVHYITVSSLIKKYKAIKSSYKGREVVPAILPQLEGVLRHYLSKEEFQTHVIRNKKLSII